MSSRDSNIELLRLVCMFLIVFQHCIHLCAFPELWDFSVLSKEVCVSSVLVGFSYIGVNCFVLISGYYGIRLRLYSVVRFYLICAFYALIGYLLHLWIDGSHVGIGLLYHSVFCISHSKLWFVKCYVGLMLLSPLLNEAIRNLSRKAYQWVLLLLTVLNIYFGFLWQDTTFNSDGYSIANFVYIYLIGDYIGRYVNEEWSKKHRMALFSTYLVTSLLWAGGMILQRFIQTPWDEWAYNNPCTIIGAVSFFLLFRSIPRFYNKWVNTLAAGAFAVYLVHSGEYFSGWFVNYVGQLAQWLQAGYGLWATVIGMLIVALAIEISVCIADNLRNALMQPVINFICHHCPPPLC